MLNEKKICGKLEEILEMMKDPRMDYFHTFPEDAIESRTSWSSLYDMATDDYYKFKLAKGALEKLLDDIDCCEYDEE